MDYLIELLNEFKGDTEYQKYLLSRIKQYFNCDCKIKYNGIGVFCKCISIEC